MGVLGSGVVVVVMVMAAVFAFGLCVGVRVGRRGVRGEDSCVV